MKLRTLFIAGLLLITTPLLIVTPAFGAEKTLYDNSNVIYTLGPVTSSMYVQKSFVKRQAAFIRRNPTSVPTDTCNDMAPADPTGIIKIICKTYAKRVNRIVEAADANKCVKIRFVNGSAPTGVLTAVTLDNSKYCR